MLQNVRIFFLDLLFPLQCLACGAADTALCESCISLIRPVPPQCFVCKLIRPAAGRIPAGRTCQSCRVKSHIYAYISPFLYRDPIIKQSIYSFKYQRVKALSSVFGRMLINNIRHYECQFPADAVVIPVPLSARRKRARGFNQSELIARELCAYLNLQSDTSAMVRVRNTPTQTSLTVRDRWKNMENAFIISHPERIKNKPIILIDDVKTTGATIDEAARALKDAGAGDIWAITIAH